VSRDANNRYKVIKEHKLSVDKARLETVRRLFHAFAIFSAENLASFTRFAFNMSETRHLLRELEREDFLVKGFFIKGEKRLYWAIKDELSSIEKMTFDGKFVLTPQDDLSLYMREDIVGQWRKGVCYVIFDGAEMVGAFNASKRRTSLVVTEFDGDNLARRILQEFERENEIEIEVERDRITDEEIMHWFETMYHRKMNRESTT